MQDAPPTFLAQPPVNSREWMHDLLRTRCKVDKLWPYQLELLMDVNRGTDFFCFIATGMGKTVVLQSGAIATQARGEKGIISGMLMQAMPLVKHPIFLEKNSCLFEGDEAIASGRAAEAGDTFIRNDALVLY
ncbi:hypothetical protein C8R44DRAFT_736977 [Mycena epipterygia]|nr:hypothetical protein C8R44DRAFT_736977 [Mycena epipterygia]